MRGWTWDNFETQYALAFFHTLQFNFPVHVERFVLVDAPAWFAKVAHYGSWRTVGHGHNLLAIIWR
jgi:hypothetical protein